MNSTFTSKLNLKDLLIKKYPEVYVDVDVIIVDSRVTMIFKQECISNDCFETFVLIAPYIRKKYGATKKELLSSFNVIEQGVFSFSFNYKKLEECNSLIVDLARKVLLKYKTRDEEILEITFLPECHKNGNGILYVKINIGYDEDDGELPIYRHKLFLEEKLQKETFVKVNVDLH